MSHDEKAATMNDEQIEVTTTDARAGTTPHIVRYILIISLTLVVGALAFVVLAGR
jgi:hypothetical protein